MPLRNNRIGIYRKYNAVITYRNVLPNIMRAIAPVLFVISLESLFFLNRVRPLRFLLKNRRVPETISTYSGHVFTRKAAGFMV